MWECPRCGPGAADVDEKAGRVCYCLLLSVTVCYCLLLSVTVCGYVDEKAGRVLLPRLSRLRMSVTCNHTWCTRLAVHLVR